MAGIAHFTQSISQLSLSQEKKRYRKRVGINSGSDDTDINLTGQLWGMPFNLSGIAYQSLIYIIIGGIAGALISGILKLLGDWLNRKRDRDDNRNRLIGQLIGQNHLILQLYAFYFFSFISHEYLMLRSTIEGVHGINYKFIIESIPKEKWSEEVMKMANEASLKSIEYKGTLKEGKNIEEMKLKLARGIKDLFTIIGSLQAYSINNLEVYKFVKDIETAMDDYHKLELTILAKFGKKRQDALKKAGDMLIDAQKKDLTPNACRDKYYYKWAEEANQLSKELKQELNTKSENLEKKINALINYLVSPEINEGENEERTPNN